MVDETLGAGCWFDPCGDPMSAAWARACGAYDIRAGEDALVLPWPRLRAFCNPPFSLSDKFLERCAQHGTRHPNLALVPGQPGSLYWRRTVWRFSSAVVFIGRPFFTHPLEADDETKGLKAGDLVSSQHPIDCAIVAFGVERARMVEVWSRAGVVVAPVAERLRETAPMVMSDETERTTA